MVKNVDEGDGCLRTSKGHLVSCILQNHWNDHDDDEDDDDNDYDVDDDEVVDDANNDEVVDDDDVVVVDVVAVDVNTDVDYDYDDNIVDFSMRRYFHAATIRSLRFVALC